MSRALRPRSGVRRRRPPATRNALPREVVAELRRVARPDRAQTGIAHLERAVELLERGDARAGAREAQRAKELVPRSPAVREVLGLALYQRGRWAEALSEMQAYRRMSGRADQNHIIADCYRALNKPERAASLAEEALASQGVPVAARVEAVIVAASALADMGRFDQALGLLRRIRTRADVAGPEAIRAWYVTGTVLERAGRTRDAAREFRKILRHDPAAYDVAERLAQLS